MVPEDAETLLHSLPLRLEGFRQGDPSARVSTNLVRQRRKDGSVVPTEVVTTLLVDASGAATQILGVTRDITARLAAQVQLQQSEQRFRLLFESAPLALALVDHSTTQVLMANAAFCDLYGYSPEEAPSLRVQDLTLEPEATLAAIAQNQCHIPLRQHRRKDGTPLPVALHFGLLTEGEHKLAVLMVQDLRPELQAQAQTLARQQHLQALVDLGNGSRGLTERALLQRAMDLAAAFFGSPIGFLHFVLEDQETLQLAVWATGTETLCTSAHDIHYPISQAGIWADAFRLRRGIIHNDYATERHRKGVPEGHFPLVREMVVPVEEDGQIRMILGVGNRVTPYAEEDLALLSALAADVWRMLQRNRAEADLRQANANLEGQVQERTRHLVHLNQELEAFSYSVSHDLRAPLRAVTGFAEALAHSAANTLTPEQQDYLQRIERAGQHMGGLIEDLLTLARLSRRELQPCPFDLGACAQEILARLREAHPERRVDLQVAPDLVVQGDPGLLRIVLDNLLGNAWKFTAPRAQAHIELGRSEAEPDGAATGLITCFVRDNGVGFPADKASRLFTPFLRLHSQEAFEGTGIGLALVRRIINRHGGRTWAEGQEGQGACFTFSLPTPEARP